MKRLTAPTPSYLLNGLSGWRAASLSGVALAHSGQALQLQPTPGSVRPLVDASGSLGGLQSAIAVALDREDRVYVLDAATCTIKRYDPCLEQFHPLPCIGGQGCQPRQFSSPHGIAISCRDDLYVADTGNRRVQIFSLNGCPLRAIYGPLVVDQSTASISVAPAAPQHKWPTAGVQCAPEIVYPPNTWQPWDVAVTHKGWCYITDYANGLVHVFDSGGAWRRALTGATASQPQLAKPTRIALDRDSRLYVLQEGKPYVVVLGPDGEFIDRITAPDSVAVRFCPVAVAVDVNGLLCLSDAVTRKLYYFQPVGNGNWCGYECTGRAPTFAASLAFDLSGNPVLVDGVRSVCRLTSPATYPVEGQYFSEALDSKTWLCTWHRVALRARIPSGCAVRIDTFTSESAKSGDEIANLPESRWSTGQLDAVTSSCHWDCLIQSPPGRFLWLRLTLSGEGTETPCIEQVRIWYPRASSLQYLPAVYREDPVSADFLARFLSIFDTMRGETSNLVATIARLFDAKATPANCCNGSTTDFLSWLASWLGLTLESSWPLAKRRELVRQAHRLFALRGTPEGLKLHIEIFAGVRPRILEKFRLRRWMLLNSSRLGDCSVVFGEDVMKRLEIGVNSTIGEFQLIDYGDPALDLFNEYAYQFLVVVPRWPGATVADEQRLQAIINLAKPAHTVGTLQWAEARMRIGIQAFIGVDTVIGAYPVGVVEGHGKLGYDTVLGTPSAQGCKAPAQLGRASRIGHDATLN